MNNSFGIPEKEWNKMVKGVAKKHHEKLKDCSEKYKVDYILLRNTVEELIEHDANQ